MATLEIRLMQQEKRKVVQPTYDAPVTQWEVSTVSLAETQLTLTINYQSDYAHWLFHEVKARNEEVYSIHEWDDDINKQPFLEDPVDCFFGHCFKEKYLLP